MKYFAADLLNLEANSYFYVIIMKFIVTTIYPSRQSLLETEQLLILVSMLPIAFVCPCSKFDDGWDTLLDADNDLDKFKEALETFGHKVGCQDKLC